MKKKILSIIMLIVLALSVVSPAYAAEPWVLSPDTEQITHGNDVYYRIEYPYSNYIDPELAWDTIDLEFPDEKMAITYADSYIYVTSGVEHIAIEAEIVENHERYSSYTYVEEAYYDEFMAIKNGKPSEYIVDGYEGRVSLSPEDLNAWSKSETETIVWDEIYDHDYFYLYATDNSGTFRYEVGQVVVDLFSDEIYLLLYEDYDESYFDAYNEFNLDSVLSLTVYELDDPELEARFLAGGLAYEADTYTDYDDYTQAGTAMAGVIATILFCIVPLLALIFVIVMLIKCKDKKYRRGFIAILIGAAVVLAVFALMFIVV